jgi:hypothetical protein
MMFIFKKGSLNGFNNKRESEESAENYEKTFGVRFPVVVQNRLSSDFGTKKVTHSHKGL